MEKAMKVHRDQGISKATQQIVGFVLEAFSEHRGKPGWALGTGCDKSFLKAPLNFPLARLLSELCY